MTLTIGIGEDERGKSRGSFSSPFGNIAIESEDGFITAVYFGDEEYDGTGKAIDEDGYRIDAQRDGVPAEGMGRAYEHPIWHDHNLWRIGQANRLPSPSGRAGHEEEQDNASAPLPPRRG